jgi:hypothetical protein
MSERAHVLVDNRREFLFFFVSLFPSSPQIKTWIATWFLNLFKLQEISQNNKLLVIHFFP